MNNFRNSGKNQKNAKHRGKRGKPQAEPLLPQPVSDSTVTVKCAICGHPVDPKRMHPHMVRFHGGANRAKSSWTTQT
jgi:hypothetical protein